MNLPCSVEKEFLSASKALFFGRTPELFLEYLIKDESSLNDNE